MIFILPTQRSRILTGFRLYLWPYTTKQHQGSWLSPVPFSLASCSNRKDAGTSLSVLSDILTAYRPALLAEESVWVPLPPAKDYTSEKPWRTGVPHTHTQTETHTHRDTHTHTETHIYTHTQTETQRHRDTKTQRHRGTEAQIHRGTETQRRKDTH